MSFLLLLFFFTQERLKININRWVVMFIIGFITGLIAFSIDCLIIIIADQKYSLIKECILFILILPPVVLHQQNLTIMELRRERKEEKPIVLKIIIIIISSLTGNYSVAQGVRLLIHKDKQLLKFMLTVELSSRAGIFFIWPDAKFPVAVIFDLGNRERLGRVKVETDPFD